MPGKPGDEKEPARPGGRKKELKPADQKKRGHTRWNRWRPARKHKSATTTLLKCRWAVRRFIRLQENGEDTYKLRGEV